MLPWVIFAVLTAFAVLIIIAPSWRRGAAAQAQDLEVYKQQLAEIDDEEARSLLSRSEAEAARIEISRRILSASEAREQGADAKTSPYAPYVVVALITGISMGFYLAFGSPDLPDQPITARLAPHDQTVDGLVARVEERLQSHPEDGAGWGVIAPVYMRLGRYGDAVTAYENTIKLMGETPERLGGLGEALTLANDGVVTDEARAAFEKVLAGDAANDRAEFWLAMSEEQRGLPAEAKQRYQKLLQRDLPANARSVIEQRLAALEQEQPGAPSFSTDQSAMINEMVQGLARRLEADGSDLDGWLKLMRAYTVLGRRDDALDALKRAELQFAGNQEALGEIDKMAKSLGIRS